VTHTAAMCFAGPGRPLEPCSRALPTPAAHEVLVRVDACAVCRTDLHVVDGELPDPKPGVVPGHEIVGTVVAVGPAVTERHVGERVGVPWLGWTCGECAFCTSGRENLCDAARFTGYDLDGGFAEHTVADERFCFPIPTCYDAEHAAPLLCAGLIGWRALSMTGDAASVGLYGFGAAAHIVAQVAVQLGRDVVAFTRPGDVDGQRFARSLGCAWAGGSDERPPHPLDAAIIFAPVGALVPAALRAVRKGGIVVCGGIHMSDIPSFPYADLWGERRLCSVANLTRADGGELLALADRLDIRTITTTFPLTAANQALDAVRRGRLHGAAVLVPDA
jgi:alcohol dehydrogenase, propanol-preferring